MPVGEFATPAPADLNVWFALTQSVHPQNASALRWFHQQEIKSVAFCRTTQLGLLRLLTQSPSMSGYPCTQREAWSVVDRLLADPKILFLEEPGRLDETLRRISNRDEVSPQRWTDDYLAAFAEASNLKLVTFDRALAGRVPSSILLTP